MLDIKQFTKKLVELKMNPNQFYFCFLLHNDSFAELYEYVENVGKFDLKDVQDLINRGYLRNTNENGQFAADAFVTTEKFSKKFLAHKYEFAIEFFEAYPSFGDINGKPISLKSVSPDIVYDVYNNITGKQKAIHEKIMGALKKGIKTGLVNMRIDKWLLTKQWELIDKDFKYVPKPGDREFTAD
jgi:hypothetical protein